MSQRQGRTARGAVVALGLLVSAVGALATSSVGRGAGSPPLAWTLAGTGPQTDTGDGGQGTEAAINQPRSVFATPDGGAVWAEPYSNRVRKLWPDGHVSTIAGTGAAGYSGDGG